MTSPEDRMQRLLEQREAKGELRSLKLAGNGIDFSSNDYLGLSRSAWIADRVRRSCGMTGHHGSTGSRLLTGNSAGLETLEEKIAAFHHAEAALVMNSGFAVNEGLLQTVCRSGDIILYDELVHASIRQGVRLSAAASHPFGHERLDELEALLSANPPVEGSCVYVVVESVYSMDGDHASLEAIVRLKERYEFHLIVDEAHALGVFGKSGRGLCDATGTAGDCFARVYTFGKALGHHGAAVVGSRTLREYLVNYCKPLIYSTAPDPGFTATVEHSYEYLQKFDYQRIKLSYLINKFKSLFSDPDQSRLIGEGPVFSLILGDPSTARSTAARLQEAGFDLRPIVYPTVPRGSERIRVSLHSFNTEAELERLHDSLLKFTV